MHSKEIMKSSFNLKERSTWAESAKMRQLQGKFALHFE